MYITFPTDFESWLEKSYKDYITAREKGFSVVIGSNRPAHSSPHTIRPSSLGNCPLKAAYEKNGVAPSNKEPRWNFHIWDGGKRMAEHLQEAMIWAAATNEDSPAVETEAALYYEHSEANQYAMMNAVPALLGMADAILTDRSSGAKAVVEFKYSEGMIKKSRPQPRLGNVLQLMAYMVATDAEIGYLVMVSKWRWDVYTLFPDPYRDDEFTLQIDGETYFDETWPSLSLETLENEMENIKGWMNKVYYSQNKRQDPPLSPTSKPGSFLCARTIKAGTKPKVNGEVTRTPLIVANCEYARMCHGMTDGYKYQLDYNVETKEYSLPQEAILYNEGEDDNDE